MSLLHILATKPELPNGARIMAEVIGMKANLNVRSSLGTTPLARACLTKHTSAVEVLLEARADVSPLDDFGRKAVLYALLPPPTRPRTAENEAQQAETVRELVQMLADHDANLDDGGDISPIVHAVREQDVEAVQSLLEFGAQSDGLHDALQTGNLVIFTELVKAEANPFLQDENGKSVMDVAMEMGKEEITTMLRNYVGDLQRKQHRHLRTLEDQMEEEAREIEEIGAANKPQEPAWQRMASHRQNAKSGNSLMQQEELKGNCVENLRSKCRRINRNKYFQTVMLITLLMALFVPDLYILMDIATSGPLDVMLMIILVLFTLEFWVQVIGFHRGYINTFFFWMDIIGVLSVPLDYSAVANALEGSSALENTVVMRAARMAKLGARAGRFTKLLKLLRFLPGMKNLEEDGGTAKVMSAKLNRALSTRVSCLIILMVLLMPMFEIITYPENDYSMRLWLGEIGEAAKKDPLGAANAFRVAAAAQELGSGGFGGGYLEQVLLDCDDFYSTHSYGPYQVTLLNVTTGEAIAGPVGMGKKLPARRQNRLSTTSTSQEVFGDFNFETPKQVDSLFNCLLILFIIAVLMSAAKLLANSVSDIVLVPLEVLFSKVNQVAADIFNSVNEQVTQQKKRTSRTSYNAGLEADKRDDEENADIFGNETRLLERVIDKLEKLSQITLEKSPLDAEQLQQLGDEDRGVIEGYGGTDPADSVDPSFFQRQQTHEYEDKMVDLHDLIDIKLEEADLGRDAFEDWDLDVLGLHDTARHRLVLSILMFHHGGEHVNTSEHEIWINSFSAFVDASSQQYIEENPYHNWAHAVDVTFTTAQMLRSFVAHKFLTATERFALVVAAVGHDFGHQGLNNTFLITSGHELALRYNDRSPLENYHCVRLFKLMSHSRTGIFDHMERSERATARATIVEAILATDTQFQCDMVKDLQNVVDLSTDLFDASEVLYSQTPEAWPAVEVVELMRRVDVRKLLKRVTLRLCDVAQPLKNIDIFDHWANLQMEEFFLQGDRELEMGIPVQPLNDRDRVNQAYTQVLFIEFLVAPLAMSMARLMPPLHSCVEILLENLDIWFQRWVEESDPVPPEEEQAKAMDRLVKLQQKYRGIVPAAKTPKSGWG